MYENIKHLTVYLAGPMRGLPLYNFQSFEDTTHHLVAHGVHVVSPHNLDISSGEIDADFHYDLDGFNQHRRIFTKVDIIHPGAEAIQGMLRRDLQTLLTVEAIVLMPGWRESTGAFIEYQVARTIGLPAYELHSVSPEATLFVDPFAPLRFNDLDPRTPKPLIEEF